MNIYSFDKVISYLFSLGLEDVYHSKREHYIKKYHPREYNLINEHTSHMQIKSFTEKLFCYCNNITEKPQCRMCEKNVTYSSSNKNYHRYCSQKCPLYDMKTLIGVENTSQLESVKQKKIQKAIEKYGVENVSKATEVKKVISKKATKKWQEYHSKKDFSQKLPMKQYRHRVQQYSETQYNKYKHIIDPENKRGADWHLDHIYSVSQAYINNVPIDIVCHYTNLRIISATENMKKYIRCDKTLEQLIEDASRRGG